MRENIKLDGNWEFELDEDGKGLEEKWFQANNKQFKDKIKVPGAWQAQGFGKPGGKFHLMPDMAKSADYLRYNSEGIGWYRKQVEIPSDWEGKLIWLKVGMAIRYTDVYINGQSVGRHEGFSTPFQFEVSNFINFGGDNDVILAVDNRPREGKSFVGWHNYFGNWGGIGRNVTLEATSAIYISDVFVKPDVNKKSAVCCIEIKNTLSESKQLQIDIKIRPDGSKETKGQGREKIELPANTAKNLELSVAIAEAELWSPENPFLYIADITVSDSKLLDKKNVRFGLREIRTEGNKILLNDSPVYLCGYGAMNTEMVTGLPPVDKKVYRERLRLMKSYGFNYARHHSWVPFEEYLEAADEIGMFVQPEAPNMYGNIFLANAEECFKEWERIILAFRNHPSIIFWCGGNESFYGPLWYQKAKQLDPTRPVNHCDGQHAFPTDIYMTTAYLENRLKCYCTSFPESPEEDERRRLYPTIAHEYGGYSCSLPDMKEIETFTGVIKPVTFERYLRKIKKIGLLDKYPQVVRNSRFFLNTTRKVHMELARMIGIQGYSYWNGTDIPESPEGSWPYGVLTWDWKPKELNKEEFNEYNARSVLLIDLDYRRRTFFSGEQIRTKALLSHYGREPIRDARLTWRVTTDAGILAEGEISSLPVCECGELTPLAEISFLPQLEKGQKAMLKIELLQGKSIICSNRWSLWIFPRQVLSEADGQVAYDEGEFRFRPRYPFLHYLDPGLTEKEKTSELAKSKLLITYYLGKPELDFLESGGRVILLSRLALKGEDWTDFWKNDAGTGFGTVIEPHPIFSDFPHDGYCDLNFFGLLEDGNWAQTRWLPKAVKPILWALVTTPWVTPVKNIYGRIGIWEAQVGKGKLLVSTQNFVAQRPENIYLFDRMLRYGFSMKFSPSAKITRNDLESTIVLPTVKGIGRYPPSSEADDE